MVVRSTFYMMTRPVQAFSKPARFLLSLPEHRLLRRLRQENDLPASARDIFRTACGIMAGEAADQ